MLKWDTYKKLKPEEKEYYNFHFVTRNSTHINQVTFTAILFMLCATSLLAVIAMNYSLKSISETTVSSLIKLTSNMMLWGGWSILILGTIDVFGFCYRAIKEGMWYKSIGLKWTLNGWKQ
jgi:hypothetical protein